MSGHGYSTTCPQCGNSMEAYEDYKPHPFVDGHCLECGFAYTTEEYQLDLEEVNDRRAEIDLEPLKNLKKQ